MCVQSSDKHIFKHIGTKSSINLQFQLIMFISNVIDSSLLIHARWYCHYISIHTLVYMPQHFCRLLDTFIWVSGVDVGLNVKMRIANVCQRRFLLIREGSVNLRVRRLFTLKFKLVICYPGGSGNSTFKAPVV